MTGWTLAIDFGTSNTAAAWAADGQPAHTVRLSTEADQMPSCVLWEPSGMRVGAEGRRASKRSPYSFVESPKLLLGQPTVLLGPDGAQTDVEVADLVAKVLAHVLKRAARDAGDPTATPDRVVLTHPADWAAPRIGALRQAWERVGAAGSAAQVVSEPVAAASWFAANAGVPPDATIGVLDYGGGTCDVAVLRHTGESEAAFKVVASHGDDQLGGNAIDRRLTGWVRTRLVEQGHGELNAALDEPENIGAMRTMAEQVRNAKEALSDHPDTDVSVAVGQWSAWVTVTSDEFKVVVADEVTKVRRLLEHALQLENVNPGDLHALYLTGGSSLIREVHEEVADLLGGRPATLETPNWLSR